MSDTLDPTVRARLEHVVAGTWPVITLSRGDVLDLLAAYDAATQARDREHRAAIENIRHYADMVDQLRRDLAAATQEKQSEKTMDGHDPPPLTPAERSTC